MKSNKSSKNGSSFINEVEGKLDEYGLEIYDKYLMSDKEYEHFYFVQDMILIVNEKDNIISVSFQATTKPDIIATSLLILKEIESLKDIDVMESFIVTGDDDFLFGDSAYEKVNEVMVKQGVRQYMNDHLYNDMFKNIDWDSCIKC